MFKKIKEISARLIKPHEGQAALDLLGEFLIHKYGSEEAARKVVRGLKERSSNDEEFNQALKAELGYDGIEEVVKTLSGSDSLQGMIKSLKKLSSGEGLESFKRLVDAHKDGPLRKLIPAEDLISSEISNKITFTIKEIREELVVNQRTFAGWLKKGFDDKYLGKRKVNLLEYIEIQKMLLLRADEGDFDFQKKLNEYYQRIEEGLVFNKARLVQITETDYRTLANSMETIDYSLEVSSYYKQMDVFPYRIAMAIIDQWV